MLDLSKKICVLGAAGSIGSRLVSILHQEGYQVTAVVRSLASAIRIGRLDVRILSLDLLRTDRRSLSNVLQGHDVIIDCTYSGNSNYDERLEESKKITKLICDAAIDAEVNRIINFGTISVYPAGSECIDESVECVLQGDSYADSKLVSEKLYLDTYADKLSVTVLQLPIVFGPFMPWTSSPVMQMKNSCLVFPSDLSGKCSPLFVDDVVKATILAIDCDASFGQRILLSDESRSWLDYYEAYALASKDLNVSTISRIEFGKIVSAGEYTQRPFSKLRDKFSLDGDFRQLVLSQWGIRYFYRTFKKFRGQSGVDRIKSKLESSEVFKNELEGRTILSRANVELFDALPEIKSKKAADILKLTLTDFDKAIGDTIEWLKYARLID